MHLRFQVAFARSSGLCCVASPACFCILRKLKHDHGSTIFQVHAFWEFSDVLFTAGNRRFFHMIWDGISISHFAFAVQRLGDRAGDGRKRAESVVAEVRTVGTIDADHSSSPRCYRAE